ncbi:MAG: hypothetical protein RIT27_2377 [Pseudomonadota bacterium]|jgi:dihydrolipoamide dehydrogenase
MDYDVLVIGAGPAGYVAAIRCAQLGMKTACVEKWLTHDGRSSLGGTCLNVGCIPSKALLDSSHHFSDLQKHAKEHGISFENLNIDISTMQARKTGVVTSLTKGIEMLFKKNKIKDLRGHARFVSANQVELTSHDGQKSVVSATTIIIATGSVPFELPFAPYDHEFIVDSTGALSFDKVPARLGIIGAGVIGLELGSVWSRLGSQVTLLEALPDFLATADRDIAKTALRIFNKQSLNIQLSTKVTAAKVENGAVSVTYQNASGEQTTQFDKLVVAVGRKPNAQGLGAAEIGLQINAKGQIEVNEFCQTNIPNIYAIGDVVRGPMLAHKGSEEGVMVAERLAGQLTHVHFDTMPWVIYTTPEIAWVGKTEAELKAENIPYKLGSFPFLAIGRARAQGISDGMIKMLAHADTDRILGVHILGNNASELLAEAVFAMEMQASSEDLARTIHAHPTLSEAMHEAALAVDGRAIHI